MNALKALAAKNLWSRPEKIVKLHEAIVNSVWKYGCVAFAGMPESLWQKLRQIHAASLKSYAGVPQCVGYDTICNHLGVQDIKTELLSFGKKRLRAFITFSPFGRETLQNRTATTNTSYRGPINSLISNEERDILLTWPRSDFLVLLLVLIMCLFCVRSTIQERS